MRKNHSIILAGHGAGMQAMSMLLTLVAGFFVAHAMRIFYVRRIAIRRREVGFGARGAFLLHFLHIVHYMHVIDSH